MVNSGEIGLLKMFFDEFQYGIDGKGRVLTPLRFRSELKGGVALTPQIEKYIVAYPLAGWKKLAVCNCLVRMRLNGFRSQRRQRDNKGGRSRRGRFQDVLW